MPDSDQNSSTQAYSTNRRFPHLPKVIFVVAVVLLSFGAGAFAYNRGFFDRFVVKTETGGTLPIGQNSFLIALSTLLNPVIYEWQGSVDGLVTTVDSKSFTLQARSSTIKISYKDGYTKFYDLATQEEVPFSQLSNGMFLRGRVWPNRIDMKFALSPIQNDIVGGVFNVLPTPN